MIARRITIPVAAVNKLTERPIADFLCVPVKVNWPELQLTEGEIYANALALVDGKPTPYPDQSIITIQLPYPSREQL